MRNLNQKEKKLIKFLLRKIKYDYELDNLIVDEIGGYPSESISFLSNRDNVQRKMSKAIIECTFTDVDNIPISISLNIDDEGHLYELDIWKVDFSKIIRYPDGKNIMKQ
ncbi:MAG: DUF6984 family protein [Polaribacter sp.]